MAPIILPERHRRYQEQAQRREVILPTAECKLWVTSSPGFHMLAISIGSNYTTGDLPGMAVEWFLSKRQIREVIKMLRVEFIAPLRDAGQTQGRWKLSLPPDAPEGTEAMRFLLFYTPDEAEAIIAALEDGLAHAGQRRK